jgi:hypothetical protein
MADHTAGGEAELKDIAVEGLEASTMSGNPPPQEQQIQWAMDIHSRLSGLEARIKALEEKRDE